MRTDTTTERKGTTLGADPEGLTSANTPHQRRRGCPTSTDPAGTIWATT